MYTGVLTIADGATESNELGFNILRFANSIVIHAPATLAGVTTVRVTGKRDPGSSDWTDYAEGGSAVTLSGGESLKIDEPTFAGLRLETTVAPSGSDEVYEFTIGD